MPGKRTINTRNRKSHEDWMKGKKIGRPKQEYVTITGYDENGVSHVVSKYWRKVK